MASLRVGIAQLRPVALDAAATVERVIAAIGDAAQRGVRFLAFPETFVPVYPLWCDGPDFGRFDHPPAAQLHGALIDQSIEVPSPLISRVLTAAADHRVAVALGFNERVGRTLYNAFVQIDSKGQVVAHRRKLVPTHGERLVWKPGDAHDLSASDVDGVRAGGLICWEHWMPAARQALHDSGEQLHVAFWPSLRDMYHVASRHYAFEGRCFVLAAGMILKPEDLPDVAALGREMPTTETGFLLDGGSAIIGPDGAFVVGPVRDREELLVADLDLSALDAAAFPLDVSGHYARPDLFNLRVDRKRPPEQPTEDTP